MPKGLSFTVDTSRVTQRIDSFKQRLRTTLTSEWDAIIGECIADVASRAPTAAEEYAYIQGYSGGVFMDKGGSISNMGGENPLRSNRTTRVESSGIRRVGKNQNSRKSSIVGDRISFIRSPGLWLEELLALPPNAANSPNVTVPSELAAAVGVIPILELGSRFAWQNHSKVLGTTSHVSNYGVWSFFEYGKSATQTSLFGKYKLKPYTYGDEFWMTKKFYPRRGMYGGFDKAVFKTAVQKVLSQITF